MAHSMALVTEYHGSLGVWVEELYREIRAGKTSIISVSASHHVSYVSSCTVLFLAYLTSTASMVDG